MKNIEQEVLNVLVNVLYEKGLVTKEIQDQAGEIIWNTMNWPKWFCYSDT